MHGRRGPSDRRPRPVHRPGGGPPQRRAPPPAASLLPPPLPAGRALRVDRDRRPAGRLSGVTAPALAMIQAAGLEIGYDSHGSGPPLVLLHGATSTGREDFAA